MSKARPILFSGPMVRALLDGRKTQTRRVCKPADDHGVQAASVHPDGSGRGWIAWWPSEVTAAETVKRYPDGGGFPCPYGAPGDVLWVKETWQYADWTEDGYPFIRYAADGAVRLCEKIPDSDSDKVQDAWAELSAPENFAVDGKAADRRWRPGIHFFRWMARIRLEIVSVRVERVHDIGKDGRKAHDVLAEGITREDIDHMQKFFHPDDSPALAYGALWDSINGKGSWSKNPWVWVVEFRRMS